LNVLVTGSTGFIGAQLCRALVERGHTVSAFHRATSNQRLIADLPLNHAIGDLTQPETIAAAMQNMDVVFHAAAQIGGPGRDHPGRMYTVTVEGTRSVFQAARQAGVRRVVCTSSAAALGVPELAQTDPKLAAVMTLDEHHTWNFRPDFWPYGYAKYLAELEVQKAVAGGLDIVIVNPTVVFGPGDIYRQDSSIIMKVANHKVNFLVEGGLNAVHILDVVDGHLAALERGRCGERYILGGENLTHLDLVRKIAGIVGASVPALVLPGGLVRAAAGPLRLLEPFLDLPISAGDMHKAGYYFYFDTRKAQVELGLLPPRPVGEAIREAYEWFKQPQGLVSLPVQEKNP
jgi:dihydroflavonol-4-reductase